MTHEITLPLSKSMALRALVIAAVRGRDISSLPLPCEDAQILARGLTTSRGTIDCGLSGAASRFLLAYHAAIPGHEVTIDGVPRLRQRPIKPLLDALRTLGAQIEGKALPLKVKGTDLQGGRVQVDCSTSSQWATALLMISPLVKGGLEIDTGHICVSAPYLEMTRSMMAQGCPVIEADWSAAAPWYQYMALSGSDLVLKGLKLPSCQGDSVVHTIFSRLKEPSPAPLKWDFANTPDIVPSVAAAACGLRHPFHFTGLGNLKLKECDRLQGTVSIMKQLGYEIMATDHSMTYDGNRRNPDSLTVDPMGDHRMAMMAAAMRPVFPNIKVLNPEVVAKSYPRFWDQFNSVSL